MAEKPVYSIIAFPKNTYGVRLRNAMHDAQIAFLKENGIEVTQDMIGKARRDYTLTNNAQDNTIAGVHPDQPNRNHEEHDMQLDLRDPAKTYTAYQILNVLNFTLFGQEYKEHITLVGDLGAGYEIAISDDGVYIGAQRLTFEQVDEIIAKGKEVREKMQNQWADRGPQKPSDAKGETANREAVKEEEKADG